MNQFAIFYFSGTGNTWWGSQRLVERMATLGFQASAQKNSPFKGPVASFKPELICSPRKQKS
jgi:hypothetical protein